jgi:DNA-directed RNA polymerase specialized sigma24 family protein
MAGQLSSVLRFLRSLGGVRPPADPDAELLRRFVTARDQDAFAEVVRRHGPLVLGLCGRLLDDPADVEDAFQATFFVLARKAATLADPGALAPWLYGVACRTARHARAVLRKRRSRERQVNDVAAADTPPEADWRDLRPLRDDEVARLAGWANGSRRR